jgi:hypothetical protein
MRFEIAATLTEARSERFDRFCHRQLSASIRVARRRGNRYRVQL